MAGQTGLQVASLYTLTPPPRCPSQMLLRASSCRHVTGVLMGTSSVLLVATLCTLTRPFIRPLAYHHTCEAAACTAVCHA